MVAGGLVIGESAHAGSVVRKVVNAVALVAVAVVVLVTARVGPAVHARARVAVIRHLALRHAHAVEVLVVVNAVALELLPVTIAIASRVGAAVAPAACKVSMQWNGPGSG